MKRITALVMGLVMMFGATVQAEEINGPSGWAREEISQALRDELVPTTLTKNYQKAITRSEYVLLALEVLDEAQIKVVVSNQYPFRDASNHRYNTEIAKAFNAGIIQGYEDGSFKPDQTISREEIATLIMNLVEVIDPKRDLTQRNNDTFSDQNLIGTWAMDSINYCFNNGLIKGVGYGQNNKVMIDPLGKTTIEQSIILVKRLVDKEALLPPKTYAEVQVTQIGADGSTTESTNYSFNNFYKRHDQFLVDVLYDLGKKEKVNYYHVSEANVILGTESGIRLEFSSNNGSDTMLFRTDDLDYREFMYAYEVVGKHMTEFQDFPKVVQTAVERMKSGEPDGFDGPVGDKGYLYINEDADFAEDNNLTVYSFTLIVRQ